MKQTTVPAMKSNITMETDAIVPIAPSAERTAEQTTEVDIESENEASTSHSNLVYRSASIFTSPMKKRRVIPRKNNLDEFDIGVVRRTIQNYLSTISATYGSGDSTHDVFDRGWRRSVLSSGVANQKAACITDF
ncbi:hypothetical protein B5X24_HaOG208005 [Helicoverpa armigera]|uniref:Uncharacterized protein n=1 Tax=Helicoverpa armigera TaxID=29058 RepID=A0A2W1BRD4_HELAM|nr:hypothetical protein B5X24_HaOG208005 [Helicoverpa armigera]